MVSSIAPAPLIVPLLTWNSFTHYLQKPHPRDEAQGNFSQAAWVSFLDRQAKEGWQS